MSEKKITMFRITQGGEGAALYVHDADEVRDAIVCHIEGSDEVYHLKQVELTEEEYEEIMSNDFDGF